MASKIEDLPKSWEHVSFGDIIVNLDGKRIPVSRADRSIRVGDFPYYGASGIIDKIDNYLFDGKHLLIAEDGANLLSRSTPIAFLAEGKFWVNNHAHVIQTMADLIPLSYLKHYFQFIDLTPYVSGSAQPKLNQKNLNRIFVPLPPLKEQHRIVKKIESLTTRSRKAREALSAIPPLLDQFRQSVLAAAFRGNLTADWRAENPEVESGEELLRRIREERRLTWKRSELKQQKKTSKSKYKNPYYVNDEILPKLPQNWAWASLDQILSSLKNGLSGKPANELPGTPILRISAVRPAEVKVNDIRFYRPKENEKIDSYLLDVGDLLFTRYNGNKEFVGVCGLVKQLSGSLLHPDKLIRVRVVDVSLCLPEYVELACNAGLSRKHIDGHIKTSAGQHGIAGIDLKKKPIPIPPISEQIEIVTSIHAQFSLVQALGNILEDCAEDAQLVDQSILAKAFRGDLVPQDPTDEPATLLLDRIRAEREKTQKAKKKTKRKKKS